VIVYGAGDGYDAIFGFESGIDVSAYSADPNFGVQVSEYGSDLVIAFGGGDNLYLVGESLAAFNVGTDLRL
jgi:hypothetical protein